MEADAAALIAHANSVTRRGHVRAAELERKMETLLTPLFDEVADEAARLFTKYAARQTLVASTTPGVTSLSTMICVKPTIEQQAALAVGSVDAEEMHCTLVYLGEYEGDLSELVEALQWVAAQHAPLQGEVAGVASFGDNGNGSPSIVLPDVPGLVELRVDVTKALVDAGFDYARNHGFEAHLTIDYTDGVQPPDEELIGTPLHFNDLMIVRGDVESAALPFTGAKPVTAAARTPGQLQTDDAPGDPIVSPEQIDAPPLWSPPPSDALIDVPALVEKLRARMDSVRAKVAEVVIKTALETAPVSRGAGEPSPVPNVISITAAGKRKQPPPPGIAYDVTNPIVEQQIKASGEQIKDIAEGSRRKIAKIIQKSYANGDSIATVAESIRSDIKRFSPARARLIARTELTGAVNGGSLAATSMLDEAAGGLGISKVWLTAPGAPNPRHETYDGLNGQTQPLQGTFDVGGSDLQYPGDPSGPPDEVCNCRCSISYTKSGEVIDQVTAEEAVDPEAIIEEATSGEMGAELGGEVGGELGGEGIVRATPGASDAESEIAPAGYETDGAATRSLDESQDTWGASLTDTDRAALASWKSEKGFKEINDHLREGASAGAEVKETIGVLDKLTAEAPALPINVSTLAYRGLPTFDKLFGHMGADAKIGQTFTDKGFQALTTEWQVAMDYTSYTSESGVLQVELPRGYQGGVWLRSAGVEDTHGGSLFYAVNENKELLVKRDQAWEIVGKGEKDGVPVLRVRPVDSPITANEGLLTTPATLPRAEEAPILKSPTPQRPYGHWKDSTLKVNISTWRRQANELLAKSEKRALKPDEAARLSRLQGRLSDAIKEKLFRAGAPVRPYAHLNDGQLQRMLERTRDAARDAPVRNAAQRQAKAELQAKARALQKEVAFRENRSKERVLLPQAQKGTTATKVIAPRSRAARVAAKPSLGRDVQLEVMRRKGGGYEIHGSYVKQGRRYKWTSARFQTKADAQAAKARHSLGYAPEQQQAFALAHLPAKDLKELGLRGRDQGYFDPARDNQKDVHTALRALKQKNQVMQANGEWRVVRPDVNVTKREPYKPPVPATTARMQRLQAAYKARYDNYEIRNGAFSVVPEAPVPTPDEVKAIGAELRREVTQRLRRQGFSQDEYGLKRDYIAARRDTIMEVLSEIRAMGPGAEADLGGISQYSNDQAASWLKHASQFFPQDWLRLVGDTRLDVARIDGTSGVTYYGEQGRFRIELDGAGRKGPYWEAQVGERVAIHELGHVFERRVPGLARAEREQYVQRNEGEKLVRRKGQSDAFVRPDEYVVDYMGRDYTSVAPGSLRMPPPTAQVFELLSIGLESLMTGRFRMWEGDPDMTNFILGLLLSL